jgi:hypothetical protein
VAAVVEELAGHWVERRAMALERQKWPTPRERRSEKRGDPPEALQGVAGGNPRVHRELT